MIDLLSDGLVYVSWESKFFEEIGSWENLLDR